MKFLLPLAFMFMFTNAYADKIDIRNINKAIKEDNTMPSMKIHGNTNPKNGDQISVSNFSIVGNKSIKFQVAPGQCYDWDCRHDRERAELFSDYVNVKNKEQWYRVSFYVPKETDVLWPTRYSIWQLMAKVPSNTHKREEHKSCNKGKNLVLAMLTIKKQGIAMSRHGDVFCGGHKDYIIARHFGNNKDAFGKWIDLTMHFGFYEDPDKGFMHIYINSIPTPAFTFKGQMYRKDIKHLSMRTGLYNSYVSKSPNRGVRTLFVDNLGLGSKCKDVQTTNFCIDK